MTPTRLARVESGLRIVLAFNEAFNRHDVPAMMALMSEDCVFENTSPAPDGTLYTGKQAVTRFWQELFRTTPDAHIHIEEILSLGNRCLLRWRYSWTGPDGQPGHVRGVDVFQVKGGLISEKLSYVKG